VRARSFSRLASWGVLMWGVAYFVTGIGDNAQKGRLLDLDLLGSTHPVGALAEWLSVGLLGAAAFVWLWHRAKRESVLLGFAVAVSFFALEGAARFKAHVFPETMGFPTKSAELWSRRYVDRNTLGFRDAEPTDGRRVVVIGDSFAFGVGVRDPSERFGEQLASALGAPWVGVNVAQPNTHTLQHIEFLQDAALLDPEVVVLLYVFNDANYLEPARQTVVDHPSTILGHFRPARLAFLNSYLFQEIYVRVRSIVSTGPLKSTFEDPALLDEHVADLERFVTIAQGMDATPILVPFEHRVLSVERFARWYESLLDAADQLPVCDIRAAFTPAVDSLTVSPLDGHPNERAHRIAALAALPCVQSRLGARPLDDHDGLTEK
jgi:hypothetical protein